MQKWEYLRVSVEYTVNNKIDWITTSESGLVYKLSKETEGQKKPLSSFIAQIGKEGWEMVGVFTWGNGYSEIYHFKRPIE